MATVTIIHFNDVYNIEPQPDEPAGGAARLSAYVKSCRKDNPLVLFSGDALNPSLMSIFLRGKQMIPVLNGIGVNCAVFGNHDFDFGVDHLEKVTGQTTFPWLLSNIRDNLNRGPLGKGEVTHMIEHNGVKIGLLGMVEEEWIATLATVDTEDVTFFDFVTEGRRLAALLRQQGADLVIALTHMRWPNDEMLINNVPEIDIVLGGHDHDYDLKQVNGRYVIKSGTDFRNCSKLTLTQNGAGWTVNVGRVDLTSDLPEDPDMQRVVSQMLEKVESKMDVHLGTVHVSLEGRFSAVRTMETNLGNFITDIMLTATEADIALLNSGTLRSDRVHPQGDFRIRDLLSILPFPDPLVVLRVSGGQLVKALENGVSQFPRKEGRFPQVAGVCFGFDPTRPSGHRIAPDLVRVQGHPLELEKDYRLVTKQYIATGHDGYDVFKDCEVLLTDEQCPALTTAVQNHFESIKMYQGVRQCRSGHRQALLPLVKKSEIVNEASIYQPEKPRRLVRQESVHDAEASSCCLCPRVEGRIYIVSEEAQKAMGETIPPDKLHHDLTIIKETSLSTSVESLDKLKI